jgi:hypothetical protein
MLRILLLRVVPLDLVPDVARPRSAMVIAEGVGLGRLHAIEQYFN